MVYGELRKLAAAKMACEAPGHTLQPTALVHEAWLRLTGGGDKQWNNRKHFFGAAAEAMRRILVEHARRKKAERRGGKLQRVDLSEVEAITVEQPEVFLALDEALEKLASRDPKPAELAKMRYFTGLTTEEAARTLGVSVITAKRLWAYARAFLYQEMQAQLGS